MINNIYAEIQTLLDSIPAPAAGNEARTRWVADFNAMAIAVENDVKHDATGAEDQVSLPPWFAQLEENKIWLYSPPLVRKAKGTTFEAVRLVVNADKPIMDIHVNARSTPVNADFKVNGQKQFACVIVNTNDDQIKDHPLVAIWFLWDSIARLGIARGLETGLITEGWVNHVFEHADACKGKYPSLYYKRGAAANEYLTTLYRLCAARGITESMLHGEGDRENAGSKKHWKAGHYTNTWIDENGICTCCKNEKPLSYGTENYPYGSILGHVLSIRHRRNAAEYLLKMVQDKAIQ